MTDCQYHNIQLLRFVWDLNIIVFFIAEIDTTSADFYFLKTDKKAFLAAAIAF